MNTVKIIELLSYTLPAIVTGLIAYRFFDLQVRNENKKIHALLLDKTKSQGLPIRLQAYERMTLFLERITLNKLLLRVPPISPNKNDYENYIIDHIEQEFEHNLTQQIYITEDCWTIISTAKNATIQVIRKATLKENVDSADQLREAILNDLMNRQSPSHAALSYIKNEVASIL